MALPDMAIPFWARQSSFFQVAPSQRRVDVGCIMWWLIPRKDPSDSALVPLNGQPYEVPTTHVLLSEHRDCLLPVGVGLGRKLAGPVKANLIAR